MKHNLQLPEHFSAPSEGATDHVGYNQRRNFVIIVYVIVLLFIVGGYVYYLVIRAQTNTTLTHVSQHLPSPSPSLFFPLSEGFDRWVFFADPVIDLSFRFPFDMLVKKHPLTQVFGSIYLLIDFTPSYYIRDKEKHDYAWSAIQLFYIYNPHILSLEELEKQLAGDVGIALLSPNALQVTNPNGLVAYYSSDYNCVSLCQAYTWTYKDGVFLFINYGGQQNVPQQTEIFHTIFNTMKHPL